MSLVVSVLSHIVGQFCSSRFHLDCAGFLLELAIFLFFVFFSFFFVLFVFVLFFFSLFLFPLFFLFFQGGFKSDKGLKKTMFYGFKKYDYVV